MRRKKRVEELKLIFRESFRQYVEKRDITEPVETWIIEENWAKVEKILPGGIDMGNSGECRGGEMKEGEEVLMGIKDEMKPYKYS